MHKLTDGLLGVVVRNTYRIEVWKTSAPKQKALVQNESYIYLSKINHDGEIGNRSIGLPESDLFELTTILVKAGKKQDDNN